MNFISDILYWISTGLLVPVIVLLIILFCRALLLAGSFYGQYMSIRKTEALLRNELGKLTSETVGELNSKLPEKSRSLVIMYMRQVLDARDTPAQVQRLLANFEIAADKDVFEIARSLSAAISKLAMRRCTCAGVFCASSICFIELITSDEELSGSLSLSSSNVTGVSVLSSLRRMASVFRIDKYCP